MEISTNTACSMPATGVWPPAAILVPVRAMTPVAGMPPNRGEAILAVPWPDHLDVGAVPAAGDGVGGDRRQQALDADQEGDGEARTAAPR